ncbi:MAG: threonine--tRNA ligase [Candidatus Marinimicrobia bacterium]|jgi:threonyl-tRNA synthetase|nr:threonine--tRNA ligase [Candidatus Neomarinimicrobiota bacterium]MBT3502645.1 threonine--tRNA ligase [Candidatus Neomarinimicrobiota bacterium]MBT3839941.1 threonine--tRNA ligase [Candidatus Neomarinimicrobiota bacterium]MBT4000184.1 threonine--tRNA ligase [Candidatus Neomarinimicrobiota bacterium]MBT4281738.1 threonine--tRNA ligase [Candidatus Neomarinimicrobiota bacterium]
MNEIKITLPDNSVKTMPTGTTAQEVADSIGSGLARAVVVAKIDGQLFDLNQALQKDCSLELFTGDTPEGHDTLLHSTAHLMAQAVKMLYPDAKVTIGPTIKNGFFYDFDVETPFSDEVLSLIEKKMKELAKSGQNIIRKEMSARDAVKLFSQIDESYKVEIIKGLNPEDVISTYTQNEFTDLCRGPHVSNTKKIKYFKLLSTSGAYWRGDENNKMLQRIYGTVFSTKNALKTHLFNLEEAKKRDHRKLGKELNIFTFDEEVGPGLPLWLPNGAAMIEELEQLAKETERKAGYDQVRTPHLTKGKLYEKSGHLDHYKESMYPAMDIDGTEYYVKPMNCPHHHKIYAAIPKSYRDLPVRLAEYGTCYRYEKSGQLFGLMRVRSLQMNDAHIYCTKEQFKREFLSVCELYIKYFQIFGIEKYTMRLSLHDKNGLGKKYVNEPKLWLETEQWVREALQEGKIDFVEVEGEAAFYGPKIDVQVWSAIGKEFTLATNQVDFAVPEKFNLTYTDETGKDQTPLCIHRAPLGTHERFIGFLIEHFGGNFPLWLAPIQIAVLPVSDKILKYATEIVSKLRDAGFRVKLNNRADKIGAKIRQAELEKNNVMLIIGEKEEAENSVSVRRRFEGDKGIMPLDLLINQLNEEIINRRLSHSKETESPTE